MLRNSSFSSLPGVREMASMPAVGGMASLPAVGAMPTGMSCGPSFQAMQTAEESAAPNFSNGNRRRARRDFSMRTCQEAVQEEDLEKLDQDESHVVGEWSGMLERMVRSERFE